MPNKFDTGDLGRSISARLEIITRAKVTGIGMENAALNLEDIRQGDSILALQNTDLMAGSDALVIAAGPSLHRYDSARMIKESGYDGLIIATESSTSWCLRNGIVPDLTITVDPHPERIVRWFGDPDLNEEALTKDDYFSRQDMDPLFRENQLAHNQELLDLFNTHGHKLRMAVASSASRAVVSRAQESGMGIYWWNPFYDDYDAPDSITKKLYNSNRLPCLNAGGNVGSACWVICHAILNKSRIAMLGMDLGYYADTPYRETQYFHELCELVGEANLDQVFVHMHNPHMQQDFYTDPAYLWYRDSFLEMAGQARAEGVTTYNCTGGGILFGDGIEFVSFDSFVQGTN